MNIIHKNVFYELFSPSLRNQFGELARKSSPQILHILHNMFLPPQFCRNELLLDNSVLYKIPLNVYLIQKIKEITAIDGEMALQVKALA